MRQFCLLAACFLCLSSRLPATIYSVTNANDSGAGSFRQALLDANSSPGLDTIHFNLPGNPPYTIAPLSALPSIDDPVIIDGTSQPGFSGRPLIALAGNNAGPNAHGLVLFAGGSTVQGLAINQFSGYGIYIGGNGGNSIEGNFIGLDVSGAHSLGNFFDGVSIYNTSSNLIGGTVAGARNVISGNGEYGVYVGGPNASGNVVQGNLIGTDASGATAVGNTYSGVGLENAADNLIGGTSLDARNVISGNGESGIQIFSGASNNVVLGNFIGTALSGASVLSNRFDGVTIEQAHANMIGGAAPGAGNVISGNSFLGVYIANTNLPGNTVQGNYIGTDASGRAALGNQEAGVGLYGAPGNTIGGANAGAGNLISANGQVGLYLTNSHGNTIQGNFIGTGLSGAEPLGNASAGLFATGSRSNWIGGTAPGAGNVVSDNGDSGIYLLASSNNQIQGNLIGADRTGSSLLGNYDGIDINGGSSNLVGGASLGAGNLICGSIDTGVYIFGPNARGNILQGNFIGTGPDGITRLDNQRHSVQIDIGSSFNLIGGLGPNEGNVIAYDTVPGFDGVRIQPTSGSPSIGNLIAGNSILGHLGLGIDLEIDGVTPNDSGDADGGANNQQNFPVLTLASNTLGNTIIQGSLNSGKSKSYRIEFFANENCNSFGYGEGQTFLGALSVPTDANGNAVFTNTISWAVPAGYAITATATDPANNTSEFSACRTVTGAGISADLRVSATATPNPVPVGSDLTWQITVQNLGPNPAYGLRLIETLPADAIFLSASPAPTTRFGNTFTFNLGALSNGMSLSIFIVVDPTLMGPSTNLVSVTSAIPDPIPANDSVNATVLVLGPELSIARSNDTVVISWPASPQQFQLEATDDLLPLAWTPVAELPVLAAGRQTVTFGISGPSRFYRLREP